MTFLWRFFLGAIDVQYLQITKIMLFHSFVLLYILVDFWKYRKFQIQKAIDFRPTPLLYSFINSKIKKQLDTTQRVNKT